MKLYWKLSMVLGLAMIVALVAAMWMGSRIGILTTTQFLQAENREPVIERASQALNVGGRESLTAWLRQNRNPTAGWTLLIVDDRNDELLDREIPGYLEGRLRAQTFFRNRSGPSSGPGNRRDRQEFDEITSLKEHQVGAGASCLALRGTDAYLAQVGPSVAYVLTEAGEFRRIEAEQPDFEHSLGVGEEFEPRLARIKLNPGDLVVLASTRLETIAAVAQSGIMR